MNRIDLSRADLNLLVLFEVVMEERHVGRAAARLNLSPSAISHALSRLRRLLNDPLFLRTPRGVVPTARALELAAPVGEVLARARTVLATAEPFDPARSTRRFTVGAPDGVSAVILPPLLSAIRRSAPGIDLSIRQVLPTAGEVSPERAWLGIIAELDERGMDVAIIPHGDVAARYATAALYDETFVIAARAGHAFFAEPTLDRYAGFEHLVVSLGGDPYGFVDEALAEIGVERRVLLTVPNFMMALAILGETDFISALPRRFVDRHGPDFGVVAVEPPMALPAFRLHAVVPAVALGDAGVAWLIATLVDAVGEVRPRGRSPSGASS
jgi:DNA-binding transcriptional LysR family regulator